MAPDRVASHQRARLEGAMVEAVARHGFAGTTLRELVGLAGVSKSTFYQHFESKQECFLATFETIIAQVGVQVSAAYREPGDFREKLVRALDVFMSLVVNEPAAAALATVDSLTLGAAGVEHRDKGSAAFEALIQQSFDHSPSQVEVPALTVKAIVAGIRAIVYRRLRAGRRQELPGTVELLVDWALGYQGKDSETVERACAAAAIPRPAEAPAEDEEQVPWSEPPDSTRSRMMLTQRERIVRAAGRIVVEKGYEALSIPAISAVAGTSNQTFYENFSNKREAFLGAFELLTQRAFAATTAAFAAEQERPEAIGAAMRAMLEHVAANELFARLAFFDLQTAGPVALDHADNANDAFTYLLEPAAHPTASGDPLLRVLVEAVGGSVWEVVQYEIAQGRTESLPERAPELTRIVLLPFAPR